MTRMGGVIAIAIALTGCERDPGLVFDEPIVATPREPCPGDPAAMAPRARAPMLIEPDAVLLRGTMPLRWIGADGHVRELGPDLADLPDLGRAVDVRGPAWDERAWYRFRCVENCERGSEFPRDVIERIDRASDDRTELVSVASGSALTVYGNYVYWGTYPHGDGGGVARVRVDGGAAETVMGGDKITRFSPYPDGLMAFGTRMLVWLAPAAHRSQLLFTADGRLGDATLDDDAFYVADEGAPYWKSEDSGYLYSIPRAGGPARRLAGPVRWPSAIAVHGDRVYFMQRESNAINAVAKSGGVPTVVLPADPARIGDGPCEASAGLWADPRGLFFLRGAPYGRRRGALYFVPWSQLAFEQD